MKRLLLPPAVLTLAVAVLLAACTPLRDSADGGGKGVTWNKVHSTLVLKLYSPHTTAGLSGAYDPRYYIPEVQIWGDGRIIWVQRDGQSHRVLEGNLTEAEVEALTTKIVDAGFFDWEDDYQTLGGNSLPRMHLLVNLSGRSKEIREHGGAPEAYYDLEAHLLEGAGAEGQDFVPMHGYLTARPFPASGGAPQWPTRTEVTPENTGDGRYVDGDLLAFAWDLVNRNPTSPVYASHAGRTYVIMIQIPGVSYPEPPRASE